jgi:lysozyme family protein
MRDNYDACLAHVLKNEGGYVDHPEDPGGATNMGITIGTLRSWRKRPVTKADVKALKLPEVATIYRANYWDAVQGDKLPAGLDLVAFDAAVNSGTSRGAKWLQRALDVNPDGRIGPQTILAAQNADPVNTINRALTYRMDFVRGLGTWATFGKGWTRRMDGVREEALRMAMGARPAGKPPSQAPAQPAAKAGLWAAFLRLLARIFGASK